VERAPAEKGPRWAWYAVRRGGRAINRKEEEWVVHNLKRIKEPTGSAPQTTHGSSSGGGPGGGRKKKAGRPLQEKWAGYGPSVHECLGPDGKKNSNKKGGGGAVNRWVSSTSKMRKKITRGQRPWHTLEKKNSRNGGQIGAGEKDSSSMVDVWGKKKKKTGAPVQSRAGNRTGGGWKRKKKKKGLGPRPPCPKTGNGNTSEVGQSLPKYAPGRAKANSKTKTGGGERGNTRKDRLLTRLPRGENHAIGQRACGSDRKRQPLGKKNHAKKRGKELSSWPLGQ